MRRFLVAGNWKMHGTLASAEALAAGVASGTADYGNVEIAVKKFKKPNTTMSYHAFQEFQYEANLAAGEIRSSCLFFSLSVASILLWFRQKCSITFTP